MKIKTIFFLKEWERALPEFPLSAPARSVRSPRVAVRKGIAVTRPCREYAKRFSRGLYFVDYFLSPSDPTSNEIPAVHPFLRAGQSADRLEGWKEAVVWHTKRSPQDGGATTNGEQGWERKTETYGRIRFIRDQIQ